MKIFLSHQCFTPVERHSAAKMLVPSLIDKQNSLAAGCCHSPTTLVSCTRCGSQFRHLDTNAAQNLKHTWGLLRKLPQFVSSRFYGSWFHGVESPPRDIPRTQKTHSESEPNQQQVAWGGKQRPHVSAAQFQEPSQHGTKSYARWVSTVKQGHTGATPHNTQVSYGSCWSLGDLIRFFTVTLKSIILIIGFFLPYEQQIESKI